MNTFGLKKKVHTFWLGRTIIGDFWEEIVRFTLNIKKAIQFKLER